jgi:peptidoglycan/xylan/chitin deacetylase (PgdA/CDA1 family)
VARIEYWRIIGGVFLTFDDGFKSFYEYAYPELVELSLPAAVFVTPAYIGTERPFPWLGHLRFKGRDRYADTWLPLDEYEIKVMEGISVGAHGYSHSRLGRMAADEVRREARLAIELIEQLTGRTPKLFAYPHGLAYDGDWTEETNNLMAEEGFSAAFNSHFGRLRPRDDRYALKRMPVSSRDGPGAVTRKIYGAYDWTGLVQGFYHGLKRLWEKAT